MPFDKCLCFLCPLNFTLPFSFFGKKVSYEGSYDWIFQVDALNPDLEKYPAAAYLGQTNGGPYEGVLEEGDLIFIPADCPHFVANLDDTIAISANYVDTISNLSRATKALEEECWLNPSSIPTLNAIRERVVDVSLPFSTSSSPNSPGCCWEHTHYSDMVTREGVL